MLKKIISSGYPGVERAALDAARKQYINFGGWISAWRSEEEPELLKNYRMRVMGEANSMQTCEEIVREADGVLIIADIDPSGNADISRRLADREGRPYLFVDIRCTAAFESARRIDAWIARHNIETLAVSGPKESQSLDLYIAVSEILETVFHLLLIREQTSGNAPAQGSGITDRRLEEFIRIPGSVGEAVEILNQSLSFQDRTRIANMSEDRLHELIPSLGMYIKNEFRLWQSNDALIRDCRRRAESANEVPASVILRFFRKALRRSDKVLRVIK